jgi:hypothetical protein
MEADCHLSLLVSWMSSALKQLISPSDSTLIRRVRDNLREMREKNDTDGVRTVLEVYLHGRASTRELTCDPDLLALKLWRNRIRKSVLRDVLRDQGPDRRLPRRG